MANTSNHEDAAPDLARLADTLEAAWARAEAVPAPSTIRPQTDLDEAYRIQDLVIARRLKRGGARAGWKMGLTSSPDATPIVGALLDEMIVPSGTRLDPDTMVSPLVEAELAFVAGEAIPAGTEADAIAAGPHEVAPALEVIDYRTRDSVGVVDWVADNSTVAYAVVGDRHRLSDLGPLGEVRVELDQDGRQIAAGDGSQVMGDPMRTIEWLASHLEGRDRALEAGAVVLTGSLTGHHVVQRGSVYTGSFGALGAVSVSFDA